MNMDGLQSHGKSSTLEAIIGIQLPKGDGTVTICPIKIVLRGSKKEYARIKFEKDREYEPENKKFSLDKIIDKITEFQNRVKDKNGVTNDDIQLFDEVIQVDVFRKNAPDLTLYDLPGLNLREDIQIQSEEINKKYLAKEGTTVLFIMSAEEEITNNYAVKWIKDNSKFFKNYQERFNPVITKADKLDNKNLNLYLEEINKLGFKNKPSLVANIYDDPKDETDAINGILRNHLNIFNMDNMNNFPVYIGIQELINHLIEIQKQNLYKIFSDSNISSQIKKEINAISSKLKNIPEKCKAQEEMTNKINECIETFYEALRDNMELLDCDEDGKPKNNQHLMKYVFRMKFKEFKKEVKEEMNKLLTKSFCNKVTYNIVESNSDHIPVFEDSIPYGHLLRPEIKRILTGFENRIIKDIFNTMKERVFYVIDTSFEGYDNLKLKFKKLFETYALKQLKEVESFYDLIKKVEIMNVYSVNKEIINKNNNLNKDINYYLLADKFKEQNSEGDNLVRFAKDFTKDVIDSTLGEPVKEAFELVGKNIDSLFKINSNFEKEKNYKKIEYDENVGIIKISYHPQNISTFNQKIILDEDEFYNGISKKNKNKDNAMNDGNNNNNNERYEFIPGYEYILKENLDNFKNLVKEKKIELITANVITEFIAYLEVMLDSFLDMLYKNIRTNLYLNLIDGKMINYINRNLSKLDFESNKELMVISPKLVNEKLEYDEKLKNLEEAQVMLKRLYESNNL
ncbi:hypothetical protein PIROE2DRAFT_63105 [Piromyces sp. E2]|nr:hypothetical protein PIROE2DRAFT_63105 [Piromyces sp. E2]|eukprot:OUM60491.1 hypothetical protein PIROE2DRAFT_63105 [Piromyces sp. E2]